jgi:alkylation response protein AidB-like acyl-CoA dehydrogenase
VNFDISEEQELLQQTISQYAENECPPTRIRELFDSGEGWDPTFWKGLAEIGVTGLAVPDAFGGAGLERLDLALAAETLGYTGAPGPFFGHALACLALAEAGSDAQKREWLPRLASGAALGTVAFAEDGGVWQPEQWRLAVGEAFSTSALAEAKSTWQPDEAGAGGATLSGVKRYVPHAGRADLIVVGTAGPGLALVTREASGVRTEAYAGVDRVRPLDTVTFQGAACEPLPGGAAAATRLRDTALVLLAADAFGSARRLTDMCVEYAKQRKQFGVTIGHFQALKHQLANLAVEVEPARALFWYAAHALDHIPEQGPRAAAIAKAHICDVAMQAARDSVELHGGIGFTWECDVQLWFKRVMFDRTFLGAPSVHRARAAELAGW